MKKCTIDELVRFLKACDEARSVTQMIDGKTRIRLTKKHKSNKNKEYILTIGRMNYAERDWHMRQKRKGNVPNHMIWNYPKKR